MILRLKIYTEYYTGYYTNVLLKFNCISIEKKLLKMYDNDLTYVKCAF